jgi:hypothetical protein
MPAGHSWVQPTVKSKVIELGKHDRVLPNKVAIDDLNVANQTRSTAFVDIFGAGVPQGKKGLAAKANKTSP